MGITTANMIIPSGITKNKEWFHMKKFKLSDIFNISLQEAYEFNKLGLIFIIKDGIIKGLGR